MLLVGLPDVGVLGVIEERPFGLGRVPDCAVPRSVQTFDDCTDCCTNRSTVPLITVVGACGEGRHPAELRRAGFELQI